jgi:hypothetical protein
MASKDVYASRRDERLLEAAKCIFGDIVDDAWVTVIHYRNDYENTAKRLNEAVERLSIGIGAESLIDEITHDEVTVVLKFSNGSAVSFWNSEWGSISRFSLQNVLEV